MFICTKKTKEGKSCLDSRLSLRIEFRVVDLIVLSGGKTGSSTLQESFHPTSKRLHTHGRAHFDRDVAKKGECLDCTIEYNRKRLLNAGHDLIIVSAFRDPIQRCLSSFFQNVGQHGSAIGLSDQCFVGQKESLPPSVLGRIADYAFENLETYDPLIELGLLRRGCRKRAYHLEGGTQFRILDSGLKIIVLDFDTIKHWSRIIPKLLKGDLPLLQSDKAGPGPVRPSYTGPGLVFRWKVKNVTANKSVATIYQQVLKISKNRFTPSQLGKRLHYFQPLLQTFWSVKRQQVFMARWCTDPNMSMEELRTDRAQMMSELRRKIGDSTGFKAEEYAILYPDTMKALGVEEEKLLDHFCTFGYFEGRRPNQSSDTYTKHEKDLITEDVHLYKRLKTQNGH